MSQVDTQKTTARTLPADLLAEIGDQLATVEARLQEELRSRHENVDQVVRHGYRLGGKRLRPALLLLSARAAGGITPEHETLAVVVEMIHTATLVHDDVLDEADLRRHVDTVNARWGNETSVLLGDFLFSHAFYLASTLDTVEACRLIGLTTNRLCEGEMRQTLAEGDLSLPESDYYEIIDAKTAELCACCCELGALYAGASAEVTESASKFGRYLGMAFQIADDLLDLEGEEQATGKSLGRDLAKRKLTLPIIHARDSLVDGPRNAFLKAIATGDEPAVIAELRRLDSFRYARDKASEYIQRAHDSLASLPDGNAKETLATMADFVLARRS